MTTIAAVRAVLPEHAYPQDQLTDEFARLVLPGNARAHELTARFHANSGVVTRHLALPMTEYRELAGFTAANDAFLRVAVELGSRAVVEALADAGLEPADVDTIVSVTTTGLAVPSLDARIAARIGLRPDVKRLPVVGLGCLAGAAGIGRVHDLVHATPDAVAVLLSVELCSLTFQRDDRSAANMVASGLFADGAAAVVAVGDERARDLPAGGPRPVVVDSLSHLYPGTDRAMGFDVGDTGLRIVLGAEVPDLVRGYLADDVKALLDRHGLTIGDVARWISHPGGPKVIEAIEAVLGLDRHELQLTWDSLANVGNLSSASVLHVFADTLARRPAAAGDWGVLMAMGPGFAAELVLLRW
ncbi:isopalmitoylresorcinol synthase [Jatrophihabitans endophyticus]|uniref:Isopalmitoylresorcinol synthase n=2 Tax=Jatrophihabitans endophyticus TaxID=1206085 RepID=A0A1M5Q8Y1_9ACTN|nr:isopalmitoylresorcinol synthase [Jatrophihabitans endophyticus]